MYLRKGLRILSDTDHQLWMTYLKINSHMSKLTLFLNLWAVFTSGVREPEQNSVAFRHEVLQVCCTQALCPNSGESTWKKGVCTKAPSEDGTLASSLCTVKVSISSSFILSSDHRFYDWWAPLTMQDVTTSIALSVLPKPDRFIMETN